MLSSAHRIGTAEGETERTTLTLLLPDQASVPSLVGTATVRADLTPDRVQSGTAGRFVSVPDSLPDEVNGHVVDAAGPPGVLRTVSFAKGETDEGLDILAPITIEGVLVVIRHPARGQFPAVVELQVREARRVP